MWAGKDERNGSTWVLSALDDEVFVPWVMLRWFQLSPSHPTSCWEFLKSFPHLRPPDTNWLNIPSCQFLLTGKPYGHRPIRFKMRWHLSHAASLTAKILTLLAFFTISLLLRSPLQHSFNHHLQVWLPCLKVEEIDIYCVFSLCLSWHKHFTCLISCNSHNNYKKS